MFAAVFPPHVHRNNPHNRASVFITSLSLNAKIWCSCQKRLVDLLKCEWRKSWLYQNQPRPLTLGVSQMNEAISLRKFLAFGCKVAWVLFISHIYWYILKNPPRWITWTASGHSGGWWPRVARALFHVISPLHTFCLGLLFLWLQNPWLGAKMLHYQAPVYRSVPASYGQDSPHGRD